MSEHEKWQIKLPSGEVRSGTLEQLDEAFHAGSIGADTLVRPEGAQAWITLAEAAGLDAPPAPIPAPIVSAPPPAVTADLDDLDPAMLAQSKRKSVLFVAAAAAAVFVLGGVFVARVAASSEPEKVTAAVAAPLPPPAPEPTQAPKLDDDKPSGRTLTEDQKKALLKADQERQDEQRRRAGSRPAPVVRTPSKDPFHKGGDKFDPLNSSL